MEKISDHIQQEVNQPQPASGYPVYNVSAPPLQPQSPEWSTGLFDCCDDPGNSKYVNSTNLFSWDAVMN